MLPSTIVRRHRERGERLGPPGEEVAHALLARGRVGHVAPPALQRPPVRAEPLHDRGEAGAIESCDFGEGGDGALGRGGGPGPPGGLCGGGRGGG